MKCQLAAETLRNSGYLRMRATGLSMLPAVLPGDILHVGRCGIDHIRTGAIAVFECYGRLVAHRVVKPVIEAQNSRNMLKLLSISPRGFAFSPAANLTRTLLTRGDSLPAPDPPVTEAQLLGTVFSIERGRRKFRPAERPGPASRLTAAVAQRSAHASKWLGRAASLLTSSNLIKECA